MKDDKKDTLPAQFENNIIEPYDVLMTDNEGEYRYNPDKDKYEYYPDWLGNIQSESDFWETV